MEFRIADTFTDSLALLTGDEQRGGKSTAFDLQLNPTNPGMSLHRLDYSPPLFTNARREACSTTLVHNRSATIHHAPG